MPRIPSGIFRTLLGSFNPFVHRSIPSCIDQSQFSWVQTLQNGIEPFRRGFKTNSDCPDTEHERFNPSKTGSKRGFGAKKPFQDGFQVNKIGFGCSEDEKRGFKIGFERSGDGFEPFRKGSNDSWKGLNASRKGSNALPKGSNASRKGLNASRKGSNASRKGSNDLRKVVTIQRRGRTLRGNVRTISGSVRTTPERDQLQERREYPHRFSRLTRLRNGSPEDTKVPRTCHLPFFASSRLRVRLL